jgi:hypothetical protein
LASMEPLEAKVSRNGLGDWSGEGVGGEKLEEKRAGFERLSGRKHREGRRLGRQREDRGDEGRQR